MAALLGGLERAAAWLARRTPPIAILAVVAALAFVVADHFLGLFPGQSARWLRNVGKGFGGIAAVLAVAAAGYYLWREIAGALLRRADLRPATAAFLKTVRDLLRLIHPLAGILAVLAAALHGFLLWSGRGRLQESSGLATLVMLLILAGSGWSLAGQSRSRCLRVLHRLATLIFFLILAVH